MMHKILLISSLLFINLNAKMQTPIITISNLHTTSHEYVYDPNNLTQKLSELIWDSKNTKLIGLEFNYLLNQNKFININYKTKLNDGETIMDDYDWLDENNPNIWSDHSNHPDTILTDFSMLDVSFNKKMDNQSYGIDKILVVGFIKEYKKFKAYNGSYIYSTSGIERDQTGTFYGLGITYIEEYEGAYLGISGNKKYKHYSVNTTIKYSPFIKGSTADTHHSRSFTDKSIFSNIKMLNIDLGISYTLTNSKNIFFNYSNIKYSKSTSGNTRTYFNGTTFSYPGSVVQNQYELITFGIELNF